MAFCVIGIEVDHACLNYGEAFCPGEIEDRSICIDGDIGAVLNIMHWMP